MKRERKGTNDNDKIGLSIKKIFWTPRVCVWIEALDAWLLGVEECINTCHLVLNNKFLYITTSLPCCTSSLVSFWISFGIFRWHLYQLICHVLIFIAWYLFYLMVGWTEPTLNIALYFTFFFFFFFLHYPRFKT